MGGCECPPFEFPCELCFTPERKASGYGLRRVAAWFPQGTAEATCQTCQEEILRRVLREWL